jgi:hypothetical protein
MGSLRQFWKRTRSYGRRSKIISNQPVDASKNDKKRDPDLVAAEVAMKRAAQKARERARQVGSGVAVLRDGKIVEERQDS